MRTLARKHLSYANVIATLALLFAMSGGAIAATHYLITSSKQISPKLLRQLKGKQGAAGRSGQTGKEGLQGPQGERGPAGKEGPQGVQGVEGPAGKGATVPPPARTLEPNQSETGAWAISTAAKTRAATAISFPLPLSQALDEGSVHYVGGSGNGTSCPGEVERPTAQPGDLCVYQGYAENVLLENGLAKEASITNAGEGPISAPPGAGVSGAILELEPEVSTTPVYASGTWAVTGAQE